MSVVTVNTNAPNVVTNAPNVSNVTTAESETVEARMYLRNGGYSEALVTSPLLTLMMITLMNQKYAPDTKNSFRKEYDYIIVGAGSSGSALASRLSEETCVTVLLLEAGRSPPLFTEVPAITPAFFRSDIDWSYKTVPQAATGRGLQNRQFLWDSGKVVGGSSVLNAMFAVRGNSKNFDDWADLGATGWSYKDVLPYFLRLENSTTEEFIRNGYHAIGGPMHLERPRYNATIKEPLKEAAEELGYKFLDSNGRNQTGFFDFEATMKIGQRFSTAKGYLVPADNRTNLDILQLAMVRKVLIEGKRARGVEFDFQFGRHEVYARREVILSAGAIGSPQLLMLSGIGPQEHLEELNIPVVANLSVGYGLQDHVASPVLLKLDITKIRPDLADLANPINQLEYIFNRTGKFAGTFGGPLLDFLNNAGPYPSVDFPDYELYFLQGPEFGLLDALNLDPVFYARVFGPYSEQPYIMCTSQILNPKSKGTVRLNTTDPYQHPIIDPKYFSECGDLETVMEGIKTCRKLCNTSAMRELGCEEFKTVYPGCEPYVGYEDKYLECMVRTFALTIFHKSCTAKMGDPADPDTVVTPELKVKGIEGLRVADASVMPLVTSGNTNLPCIMIGEKAADMIKETFSCPESIKGPYGVQQPATERVS